jgi:hypothetical protein
VLLKNECCFPPLPNSSMHVLPDGFPDLNIYEWKSWCVSRICFQLFAVLSDPNYKK